MNFIYFLKYFFQNQDETPIDDFIVKIALNKSENCIACITSQNRLYKLDLNNDLNFQRKFINLKLVQDFHYSKIIALDTCEQKPLLLSVAQEKSIKLWNYEDQILELSKHFEEKIYFSTLHPSGLYLALSFFNKINLYSIILNDLKLINTFELSKLIDNFKYVLFLKRAKRNIVSKNSIIIIIFLEPDHFDDDDDRFF